MNFTGRIGQTFRQAFGVGSIQDDSRPTIECDQSINQFFGYGPLEQTRLNAKKTAHVKKLVALAPVKRQVFDANNPDHRAAYLNFKRTGKWELHFYTEWPALTVPHTIQEKLVELALSDTTTQTRAQAMLAANDLQFCENQARG